MSDLLRQEISAQADRIVVKVGTRVLTRPDGRLDGERIRQLGEDLTAVRAHGRQVVLVSSGAVGAGMGQLGLAERPRDLARLQAVAAVGQTHLIERYDRVFRQHGHRAAQVLLTAEDLNDRGRYLNVRNTLLSLLAFGAIPIINENDTVAVDELMATFGDNDRLAALVTNLLRAPLLVVLSDVDALYDGDPHEAASRPVATVRQPEEALAYVRDKKGQWSKGGMASKLAAATIVTTAGENMIIAGGRRAGVLQEILAGQPVGTLFLAQGKSVSPWKRWLGFSATARGRLLVDQGACQAVCQDGRSLLAIGILRSAGDFEKGDVVSICNQEGREVGRGLTNYSAREVERIKGVRSDRISQILGHCPYEEVIHRDNLTLFNGPTVA